MLSFLTLPKPVVVVLALALTFFIGALDQITGRDFAVSPFYLIPISWAGWVVGRRAGMMVAALSAVAWFLADQAAGFAYKHPLTPYWNALMLAALFLVVVYLLSAFQEAHYHLEEVVENRTAALQAEITKSQSLERAKLQAERLAALGTIAAEVAHEVRNPLGSITLNLDLMEKEFAKIARASSFPLEEGRTLLKEIREEIGRIKRVTEDCLQFTRLHKTRRRPVVLNDFLRAKLSFLQGEFDKAGVKLRASFDPALTTIEGDGEQLWQAALNLIRNSLDAMPDGGELTVGTRRENDRVLLTVKDNGKGMTEEQRRQIFTPFFTTKPRGTGLGLALVQQIAAEHGGHVECQSEAGRGSAFTLFLPVAADFQDAYEKSSS